VRLIELSGRGGVVSCGSGNGKESLGEDPRNNIIYIMCICLILLRVELYLRKRGEIRLGTFTQNRTLYRA